MAADLASEADPGVVATVFFDDDGIVFVSCTRAVFGTPGQLR